MSRHVTPADPDSPGELTTRRSFLTVAASMLCAGGMSALQGACASGVARTSPASPSRPPTGLRGEWLTDDTARRAAADDWGHLVHRTPLAVLRPASAADVIRVIRHATAHGLTVAMRGRGHCAYGQAQAASGVVIDSRSLSAVRWGGNELLDVEAGTLWADVARATLARGLIPPVMPDALALTVGGTLSVGGTGDTSHRVGAQVDHVLELDVVTGAGQLVTCSPAHNGELFQMALAGLGQCGIIIRARLRLVRAPEYVEVRRLAYEDHDTLLADLTRLADRETPHVLSGEVTRSGGGRWRFQLVAGDFLQEASDATATPPWLADLRFRIPGTSVRISYWDHLDRRTTSIGATKAAGRPNPDLIVVLPANATSPFLAHLLANPAASVGIWRVEALPVLTARFTQPLHRVPAVPLAFTLRLQRRASAEGAPDHEAMLNANRDLLQRALAGGGNVYPPLAPPLSREEWRAHYGGETWRRLVAAKALFDPENVLTPGAGVFS